MPEPDILLSVRDLHAHYGESHILHGMSFDVPKGEVVTLLGRNGVGKTTTMRCLMGIVGKRTGSVRYQGTETINLSSNRIARLGLAYCPEERGIFSSLTVRENMVLPPVIKPGGLPLEEVYELFPRLIPLKSRTRGRETETKRSMNSNILSARNVTRVPIGIPSRSLKFEIAFLA